MFEIYFIYVIENLYRILLILFFELKFNSYNLKLIFDQLIGLPGQK